MCTLTLFYAMQAFTEINMPFDFLQWGYVLASWGYLSGVQLVLYKVVGDILFSSIVE